MNSFNTNTNRFLNIHRRRHGSFLLAKTLFASSGVLVVFAAVLGNNGAIYAAEANTTFEVNVKESLSVSITAPSEWANGDAGDFLRNDFNVSVTSNNANGFKASMFSQTTTNLTNMVTSTETIPTLGTGTSYTCTSAACSAFPANYWGYSLNDSSNTGTYYPMVSTSASPITLINASAGTTTGSQDVYFGAKADMTKAAGTYTGTVIISVVTGTIDNNTNPVTPTNPATPNNTSNTATYNASPVGGSTNGTTTYTYRRSNSAAHTTTTTTQVSDGNNVSAYNGYTPPQGVRESVTTNESINDNESMAAGLATAATIAAATGLFFFVLAKRREDDEEDEEQQMI